MQARADWRIVVPWRNWRRSVTSGLFFSCCLSLAAGSDALADTRKTGLDGAAMAFIPAGAFVMGSSDGQDDERPAHVVKLSAFYMDRHEVTVAQYARFLKAVNAEHPMVWGEAANGRHDKKPVVGIDWFDASEYCEWAGKRLPTEAEWEKAARGTDERPYPWGPDPPTRAHANFNQSEWRGYRTVTNVGQAERGSSPFGIYDLAGNVWEWTADRYEARYYENSPVDNPPGPSLGPLRVLRGGGWNSQAEQLRAANRGGYPPAAHRSDFGFRCAMDALP